MAVPGGLEPPTNGLGNRCSVLLSYGTSLRLRPPAAVAKRQNTVTERRRSVSYWAEG